MKIFKNKAFSRWAAKEGLTDEALWAAVAEMGGGLVDADLGGRVFKKRVAVGGRGKSGGARTLLAYKEKDKAFFVYGFAKNARANIKSDELRGLKTYAGVLLSFDAKALKEAVKTGVLIEVNAHG